MLKLIRLELEKTKFSSYLISALITMIALAGLSLLIHLVPTEPGDEAMTMKSLLDLNNVLSQTTFIIFSSVLMARLVIEEYRNKTIQLLFTYPVNRKKLLTAKLLIVAMWTFLSVILSTLVLSMVSLTINHLFNVIEHDLTNEFFVQFVIKTLVSAIAAAGMAMIPLFFGMLRKSVPATIVSAVVMISLISSGGDGFTLSSIVYIPIGLAIIGAAVAWMSIRKIETADL